MSSAGQQLVAGRVPGELIDETEITADSATFTTTETTVITLTVPLVSGRMYKVVGEGMPGADAAGADIRWRIREDNSTGNELQTDVSRSVSSAAVNGDRFFFTARYTAASSSNKTFVLTGVRVGGAAQNMRLEAAASRPAYLSVYYHTG